MSSLTLIRSHRVSLVIPASLKHTLQVPHNLYCRHIQHHKLFPTSRLRRPSCARGSKGQRRRNAISPTAAAVFQDQSRCRPALPGTSINKTVSGCSADTRTHSPVRSDLPLSGASFMRRNSLTRALTYTFGKSGLLRPTYCTRKVYVYIKRSKRFRVFTDHSHLCRRAPWRRRVSPTRLRSIPPGTRQKDRC